MRSVAAAVLAVAPRDRVSVTCQEPVPCRMYGSLLVPTDGSQTAQRAAEHAVGLAEALGAELHVLHVIDEEMPHAFAGEPWADWDSMMEAARDAGCDHMEPVIDAAHDAELAVHAAILEGKAVAGTIEAYAEEHGVEAIVMGTQGRSGLARFLLGSVAERVVRATDRPVLLVPARQGG